MYHEPDNPFDGRSLRPADVRSDLYAWRKLADCASLPTQSDVFVAAMQQHLLQYLETCQLHVPAKGEPIACIALCRSKGPISPWRMSGDDELFEPFDALISGPDAAAQLAIEMTSLGRALDLGRAPANSPMVEALRRRMRGRGLFWLSDSTPAPYLPLSASWRAPLDNFSSRRRSDFRRASRRADELGTVEFSMLAPSPGEFDALFDEAIAVEARSWKSAAGSAILCDPRKEAFFRRYLKAMSEKRQSRIAFMRIDGTPVAVQLAVTWDDRYWLYKIGFDETYARCSPGSLLMLYVVGEAARVGLRAVEFMGEAESWITDLWTKEQHEFVHVRAYPLAPAAIGALACDAVAWFAARLRGRKP